MCAKQKKDSPSHPTGINKGQKETNFRGVLIRRNETKQNPSFLLEDLSFKLPGHVSDQLRVKSESKGQENKKSTSVVSVSVFIDIKTAQLEMI